jgi:oxaloacetate decarboxylase alpha subunit
VQVSEGGEINQIIAAAASAPVKPVPAAANAEPFRSPLAGNIFTVAVKVGETVNEGQVLIIMEAMKMETELRSPRAGIIHSVSVAEGNSVAVGDELLTIG